MQFRTPVHIAPLVPPIDHHRRGLLLGSCFAEHIGERMSRAKLPVTLNPFGILFNPASIAATLERLRTGQPFTETDLLPSGDRWVSLAHHGRFSSPDKTKALEGINRAVALGHKALDEADYLVLTLGTAWVYEYTATGTVVANCHKLPATAFRRRRMSPTEIIDTLENALQPYLNNKQVILTISPVRHGGDGSVENQRSKATLIVAAAELAEKHTAVTYFPAYEIMMDELRDYRFYQPDMLHPSDVAVGYIWERFCDTAFSPGARQLATLTYKLAEAMEHRPLNPDSEAHRAFRHRMRKEALALQAQHPGLDFSPEIAYFAD